MTSHDWFPALILLRLVQSGHHRSSRQAVEFLRSQIFSCCREFPSNMESTPPALGNGPSITGKFLKNDSWKLGKLNMHLSLFLLLCFLCFHHIKYSSHKNIHNWEMNYQVHFLSFIFDSNFTNKVLFLTIC